MGCWRYLERLEAVHAAAAAAPHEAEPLDPVVGGHGGVPDPPAPIVHGGGQAHAGQYERGPANITLKYKRLRYICVTFF